jgi:hypothetical protein
VLRNQANILPAQINLFGDKACDDRRFKDFLQERRIDLLTSIKKPKKAELSKRKKHYNKLIYKIKVKSFLKIVREFTWNRWYLELIEAVRFRSKQSILETKFRYQYVTKS